MSLTRTQLDALTALHQHGRQDVRSRSSIAGRPGGDYSARTLQALVDAGLAQWTHASAVMATGAGPVVNVYADGSGRWRAEVPATVPEPDRAAVARAAILGEVWKRSGSWPHLNRWRPRVVADGDNGFTGAPISAPATLYFYREV